MLYNAEKFEAGVRSGDVIAALDVELEEGRALFAARIDPRVGTRGRVPAARALARGARTGDGGMSADEERERGAIARDLASADEEVRRLAVERIALLPPDEVVPRLVELPRRSLLARAQVRGGAAGRLARRRRGRGGAVSRRSPTARTRAVATRRSTRWCAAAPRRCRA